MKRLLLGVIGHVDHGKTALVKALTGTDTDRLAEEKERGISIALGFAHLNIDADTQIDLIDMPGHERFVRTMISGATGMDAVLLVVAANEGVKPQTREHIDIAGLLGLRRAVIAVSKIDLVSQEQAAQVGAEAQQLLAAAGITADAPIMTCAQNSSGIDTLRHALASLAANQKARTSDGLVYLPIDRAFSIAGHGPVVTGTLRGAPLQAIYALEVLPQRRPVRVRAVQVHGARVDAALPGQRVALNLRDIEVAELERGMVVATPDTLVLTEWLTIAIRAVKSASQLKNGMRLRALVGTTELDIRLRLLDRDVLEPGDSGFAQLHCATPIATLAGEHVVLRIASPPQTVAGGKVLEPTTRRLRRKNTEVLRRLTELNTLATPALVTSEVKREAAMGTTLRQLSQLTALATTRIVQMLQTEPVVVTRSGWVVMKSEMDALLARIPAVLAPQTIGLTHDKLLARLPGTSVAVLSEALAQLLSRGTIVERGKQLLLPQPDEDRARALNEAALAGQIAQQLQSAGLTPPNPGEIVTSPQAKRAVDRLLRERIIVRAVDRAKGREMLFHRDAIAEAQRRLTPLLEQGSGLLVTEIGVALGISRKYNMPLLDHLDAIRFTRRIDDRRVLAKPKS